MDGPSDCGDAMPADLPSCRLDLLPPDAFDVVLSFLFLYDLRAIDAMGSRSLSAAVSDATVLHMSPTSRVVPKDEIRSVLRRHAKLNSLHLQGLGDVGDDIVRGINHAPCAGTLKRLSLTGCALSYWCSDSLNLPCLQSFRLTGGSIRVSVAGMLQKSVPSLRRLVVSQCPALRDESVQELSTLLRDTLEELQLNHCVRLQRPILQFRILRRLRVVGGFTVQAFPCFECPNIQCLDLSFCVKLTSDALSRVLSTLPQLQELKLVKCCGLTEQTLNFAELKKLDVTFCHMLRELHLDCPTIAHLHTSGCSSLETLVVKNAARMKSLNVVSMYSLRSLEIHAVNLSSLKLMTCRRLDRVHVRCPNLRRVDVNGSRAVALRHCESVWKLMVQQWSRSSEGYDDDAVSDDEGGNGQVAMQY